LRYVVSNPETKQSHVVGGHFGVPIFLHIKKAPMNNPANDPHSEGFVLDPRRWLAMAVLLIAGFMNLIDITIVNVALPSLQKGLGASSSQIEWVVAAYVLAFALGLLPFGRLGDIVGRKTIFLWGVAGFTIGSFLCGIAPSINILIVARVLQGLAGAMMMPQVLAIMQVTFPPEERGFAFSLFGLTAGLASVAGPIVGGLLISANLYGLDWRPIFLVNIPIGIIAVIAAWRLVPATPPHPGHSHDVGGIVIATVAVLLLVFPLIEGRSYGWPNWAFAMIAASFVGFALFYLWERGREASAQAQLLNVSLMKNRNFAIGAVITMIFFSGLPGFFLILAIFLQSGFGYSPLESGIATIPFPVGVLVASVISGRLANKFLMIRLAVGALMLVIGMVVLRMIIGSLTDTVNHWWLAAPLAIAGFGLGVSIAALFQTILSGVPHRDAGSGSGALQAFQQIGGALGVALVGELFFSALETQMATAGANSHAAFVNAARSALIYEIAVFAIMAAMVPLLRPAKPGASGAPVAAQG
jgi:EmrB/QacA subfamily drug resistance transporter